MTNVRTPSLALLSFVSLSLLPACKSAEQKEADRQAKIAAQEAKLKEQMHANVPEDSPLRQVTLGMSEQEVVAILGPQTSTSSHMTGKQYIPFNYRQRDTMRIVYHWQGIGRVEFSQGSWGQRNGAILCVHDANETGEKPAN
jgi:outer membrane protein assembly factor BamE (lipoprotein component of BamABCDE complex)